MSKSLVIPAGATGLVPAGAARGAAAKGVDPAEVERLVAKARREAAVETEARLRGDLSRLQQQDRRLWENFEERFQEFMQSVEREIAEQLIRVSVRLAGVILRRELPDQAMLEGVIRETLSPISDLQGAKVRMNPEDARRFKALREQGGVKSVPEQLEVVADSALEPGDLVLESRNGYFDARLEQRLKLLEEKLKERYRSAHAGDDAT